MELARPGTGADARRGRDAREGWPDNVPRRPARNGCAPEWRTQSCSNGYRGRSGYTGLRLCDSRRTRSVEAQAPSAHRADGVWLDKARRFVKYWRRQRSPFRATGRDSGLELAGLWPLSRLLYCFGGATLAGHETDPVTGLHNHPPIHTRHVQGGVFSRPSGSLQHPLERSMQDRIQHPLPPYLRAFRQPFTPRSASSPMALAIQVGRAARADASVCHSEGGNVRR